MSMGLIVRVSVVAMLVRVVVRVGMIVAAMLMRMAVVVRVVVRMSVAVMLVRVSVVMAAPFLGMDDYVYICAGDRVFCRLFDLQVKAAHIQLRKLRDQTIAVDAKVQQGAERHISADA
jgi:hypothetical protein